jgi:Ca2+-binding EF-hand superfamily protein
MTKRQLQYEAKMKAAYALLKQMKTLDELVENLPELIDMYRNGDIKFSEMIRMFHEAEENILVKFEI